MKGIPRPLFHADKCCGVKRIDIGPHHIFKLRVWKLPDHAQLIFRTDVFRALKARSFHDDQGVAIQISLSSQHDLVFHDKQHGSYQCHQDQSCSEYAFCSFHG